MKYIVLMVMALLLGSCQGQTEPAKESVKERKYLEIYTPGTILYVDVDNLSITSENDDTDLKFKTFREMSHYIERRTADELLYIYQEQEEAEFRMQYLSGLLEDCKAKGYTVKE